MQGDVDGIESKDSDGSEAVQSLAETPEQDHVPDSTREERIRRRAYESIWSGAESPAMTWKIGFWQKASWRQSNPNQRAKSAPLAAD